MASTSVVTAPIVMKWFNDSDEDRIQTIYSGFQTEELVQILRLPTKMCSELIKNLGFNFNKHLSFNSANLKDNTYTTLQNFNKITETATQKSIMK